MTDAHDQAGRPKHALTDTYVKKYIFWMDTFSVLAEPNRRSLLAELGDGPKTVGALSDAVGLSQPAVSKHLRVLKNADLVRVRPDGQRRWYDVNPEPLMQVEEWLEPFRKLWAGRLDRLEEHLDATAPIESTTSTQQEQT